MLLLFIPLFVAIIVRSTGSLFFGRLFPQAVAAAKNAAKGIKDMEAAVGSDSESADGEQISPAEGDSGEHENDELRKSALDKLERASEDSFFGQASHM